MHSNIKKALASFVISAAMVGSANAAIIINSNGSSISYGSSWDVPSLHVEQVLANLGSSYSGDLHLTLVNGVGGGSVESWFGTGASSIIIEEIAGYANKTTFGWYDVSNASTSGQLFSGSDSTGAYEEFSLGGIANFGFYIDPNGVSGNRMYTERANNTHNDIQVAIFRIEEFSDWYVLGWEDLDLNGSTGGDRDYQDMIVSVRINSVPEPSALALFGLGLLGVGLSARRKKRA